MSKATLTVVEPDRVVFELNMQAELKTWGKIRDALDAETHRSGQYHHDLRPIREAIAEAIRKAQDSFVGVSEEGDQE